MQPKATSTGSMRSLLHAIQNPWRTLFQHHHHRHHHRYHVHSRCGPVRATYSVTTAVVVFATAAAVRYYYQKSTGNDHHLYRLVVFPYTTSTLPLRHSFVVARSRNIPTTCCEQTSHRSDGQRPVSTTTTAAAAATTKTTTIPIPEPPQRHVILPPPPPSLATTKASPSRPRSGIFVMGDVHGCYDEMMQLYQQAVIQNGHCDFHYVILVGDICNKGPQSMAVIRHMRQQQQQHSNWICIRGNHENAVLRAYLEMNATTTATSQQHDVTTRTRYHWLLGTETATVSDDDDSDTTTTTTSPPFTQDDFEWMSRLPYTIRIPVSHIGLQSDDDEDDNSNDDGDHERADHNNHSTNNNTGMVVTQSSSRNGDVVIVHAGLRPELPIEANDIPTMVVLRELDDAKPTPWAQVWEGPELVIFGHDAKRGLQLERHAIGLDTGCVYGNQLTGLILPSRTLVQVPALKPHVPVVER